MKFLKIFYRKCRTPNASMLWNFYFDLTDDVKIQKLAVNVYFGNNMVMVILLKARIEYPFAHSLSHLKPCNSPKKFLYR